MVASTFHVGRGPSNKIIYVSYVPGGCMWGPLGQLMSFNVISVDFKDSYFEFWVNQESYGFFSVIIGFFIHKNMDLETKILSIYPRCGVISENVISLRWWPFWKWRYIGSPSNLVVVALTFHVWWQGYTDIFNLGLNNMTPHAHRFPPRYCVLTCHRLADHVIGYTQTLQPHIFIQRKGIRESKPSRSWGLEGWDSFSKLLPKK